MKEYLHSGQFWRLELRKWQIVTIVLVVAFVCVGAFFWWFNHSFTRTFDLALNKDFGVDVQDLQLAIKGRVGEFYFGPEAGVPLTVGGKPFAEESKKLLADYRDNRAKYQKYAKLMDAVYGASKVAEELRKIASPNQLPKLATRLVR